MNCQDHRNEELAHCPSCLACYWEMQYKAVKSRAETAERERDELIKLLAHEPNVCPVCGMFLGLLHKDVCPNCRRLSELRERLKGYESLEKAATTLSGAWGNNGPINDYMDDMREALAAIKEKP